MALDNNSLTEIKALQKDILDFNNKEISSHLDSFQDIITDTNYWGNETVVGQECCKNMNETINEVVKMVDKINQICSEIDDFCSKQEQINNN